MLSPLDVAWLVIKEEPVTPVNPAVNAGMMRYVYEHPNDPTQYLKIPRSTANPYFKEIASNAALSQMGEQVEPERPVLTNTGLHGRTGSIEQVIKPATTQRIVPGGPVQESVKRTFSIALPPPHGGEPRTEDEKEASRRRQLILDAQTSAFGEDTFLGNMIRDLHTKNIGFDMPPSLLEEKISDKTTDPKELGQHLMAFDPMAQHLTDKEVDKLVSELLEVYDKYPEKLERYAELMQDRSQFDPLMDALYHQPNPLPASLRGREGAVRARNEAGVRRDVGRDYNDYIKELNNLKRAMQFIKDPQQTTLNEFFKPIPRDHPDRRRFGDVKFDAQVDTDTIIREAVRRSRAKQAEAALDGLREDEKNTSRSTALRAFYSDIMNDMYRQGYDAENAILRNDMGANIPFIRNLLGREQERQVLDAMRSGV